MNRTRESRWLHWPHFTVEEGEEKEEDFTFKLPNGRTRYGTLVTQAVDKLYRNKESGTFRNFYTFSRKQSLLLIVIKLYTSLVITSTALCYSSLLT